MLVSVRLDRHARWRCQFVDRTETNMSVEIKGIVMGSGDLSGGKVI